jgi:hypothetical protein
MSFINYLREAEKKEKEKKEKKVAVSGTNTPGNSPDVVPGAAMGVVINPQQPPVDNVVAVSPGLGNLEAYNVLRAFAMGMENNMSSIVLLKSHPTPEIAQQATVLEKDVRAIIQYIMNMQIPL